MKELEWLRRLAQQVALIVGSHFRCDRRSVSAESSHVESIRGSQSAGEQQYLVWNNDANRTAVFERRECIDLGFDAAFEIAERLRQQMSLRPT
jgi:hypothetical protein